MESCELRQPLPSTQTAIVIKSDGTCTISHEVKIPTLEDGMVLVKVEAVGINPCDFKMPAKYPTKGAIVGCDFAGKIAAIGPGCEERKLNQGDRVAGGVHGSNPARPLGGAFAEYISAHIDILFKIPDTMSYTSAAALAGTSFATLCLALWDHGLQLPGSPEVPTVNKGPMTTVLVHGGSTTTGTMALQLLRLSGFTTIATCSTKNFPLVKSYGADHLFDYNSPSCAQDIKKLTKNALSYVLDVITDTRSVALCHAAMGRAGGRYIGLEKLPENCDARPTVAHNWVLGISVFGQELLLDDGYEREADPCHLATGKRFFLLAERLVHEGKLRPHPPKILPGAWEGVLQGIEMKRRNEVSGEKLVVHVA